MMKNDLNFHSDIFESVMGGLSIIDVPRLRIHSLQEAYEFINTYGFDLNKDQDSNQMWIYHRKALAFLHDHFLQTQKIPEQISDLKNLAQLFIYASSDKDEDAYLQKISCAILRVIHVLVHLDNDLFHYFSEVIQDQVFQPIKKHILTDPVSGDVSLIGSGVEIPLRKFEIKPFKTNSSSIIKLLAKPETVAQQLMDKIGVRLVTKHIYDSFRVIRFFVEENIISSAHLISNQSNNTLYPLKLFFELINDIKQKSYELNPDKINELLQKHLKQNLANAEYLEKENIFSGENYRFIKFICRELISVSNYGHLNRSSHGYGKEVRSDILRFFYPYEVQVLDYDTYIKNLSGPSSHEQYKERQKQAALKRVLG